MGRSLQIPLVVTLLLYVSAALATERYGDARAGEIKRIKTLLKQHKEKYGEEWGEETRGAADESLARLKPLLAKELPKLVVPPNWEVKSETSPNLFFPGDIDSHCIEATSYNIEEKSSHAHFHISITNETMIADAKANGSLASLNDSFCTDALMTPLIELKPASLSKHGIQSLTVISESTSDINSVNGIVAKLDRGKAIVFIEEYVPEANPDMLPINAKCSQIKTSDAAAVKCFKGMLNERNTKKLIEIFGQFLSDMQIQ